MIDIARQAFANGYLFLASDAARIAHDTETLDAVAERYLRSGLLETGLGIYTETGTPPPPDAVLECARACERHHWYKEACHAYRLLISHAISPNPDITNDQAPS